MADRPDISKRLLTLTGVLPLSIFLIEHIGLNASALGGASRFDAVVGTVARSSFLPAVEIALVLAPLAFHALYGLHVLAGRKPPIREYPLLADRMVLLQRVSSVVLLVFVAAHLWELRVHRFRSALPASALHARLAEHLSSTTWGVPWIAVGYVLGVLAATFHFANGLWAWSVSTRGLVSEKDKKRAAVVPFGLGALLFVIATATIVTLANGGGFLPEPPVADSPCGEPMPSAGRAPTP